MKKLIFLVLLIATSICNAIIIRQGNILQILLNIIIQIFYREKSVQPSTRKEYLKIE